MTKIAVALDVPTIPEALRLVDQLRGYVDYFKVGLQLLHGQGTPQVLRAMNSAVIDVMLDWKLKDISETVALAVQAISEYNVAYFNLHVSTGNESILRAFQYRGTSRVQGVTVLTSLSSEECVEIYGVDAPTKVLQFARTFADLGGHAIICSPKEASTLRDDPEVAQLERWTPGIRSLWAVKGDQSRVLSPADAMLAGADVLVIGRPITQPPAEIGSPRDAAQRIWDEIYAAGGTRSKAA